MELEIWTPQGKTTKTLTEAEIAKLADFGHTEAKKEQATKEIATAKDVREELNAIEKFLGLI